MHYIKQFDVAAPKLNLLLRIARRLIVQWGGGLFKCPNAMI